MSNNLRKLSKDLRSYAKRCKDVKYTSGLLLTFLLTGMLSLSTTSVTNRSIEQQRQSINNSISDMKQSFRRAKSENNKLLLFQRLRVFSVIGGEMFFLQMGKNSDYLNKKAHQVIRVGFR